MINICVCRAEAGQEILPLLLTKYTQHATVYLLIYLLNICFYLLNNEHIRRHFTASNYEQFTTCLNIDDIMIM